MGSCPGCAGAFPDVDGPTHPYMESSPGCWRSFGEVLAADYSSSDRMAFHQIVVDAYAAQHPGAGDRRQVQSVGLHLMTLCLFLDHDVDPAQGPQLHRRMVRRPEFRRLHRSGAGDLTVAHLAAGAAVETVRQAADEWARTVWTSYEQEHATVRGWLRQAGFEPNSRI